MLDERAAIKSIKALPQNAKDYLCDILTGGLQNISSYAQEQDYVQAEAEIQLLAAKIRRLGI